jgi:hypothetical protein
MKIHTLKKRRYLTKIKAIISWIHMILLNPALAEEFLFEFLFENCTCYSEFVKNARFQKLQRQICVVLHICRLSVKSLQRY